MAPQAIVAFVTIKFVIRVDKLNREAELGVFLMGCY